jgi:hypothetical protein
MSSKNKRHGILAAARAVCNVTHLLGDGSHLIHHPPVRDSVRAISAVRNSWACPMETKLVADKRRVELTDVGIVVVSQWVVNWMRRMLICLILILLNLAEVFVEP